MKKARTTGSAEFDAFWAAYPRHTNKLAAKRKWDRLKPSAELLEKILAALAWQCEQPRWQEEEFIPHASTYLHNARWEDEPPRIAVKPDARGHLPPCRTNSDCNKRLEQEIAARKAATT